jgi:hypothetical protein
MPICHHCAKLYLPLISSGLSSEGYQLASNLRGLMVSANTCPLCHLFLKSLENVRIKGIRNGIIKIFSWSSIAQGDPVGVSRVFVRVGDTVGRFVDVYIVDGMFFFFLAISKAEQSMLDRSLNLA